MNRKEIDDAIRLSLLLGESPAERHGVYLKRPDPDVEEQAVADFGSEDPDFPGCYW
jgi:hypothetical protein